MKSIKALCLIVAFAPIVVEYDNVLPSDITPLHRAAMDGDIEQVAKLISGGFYVNLQNMVGNAPLHLAAQNGHKDIVEFLLAGDADVNIKNMSGRTPLHYAAQQGHMEVSELLITKGALVDARNKSGGTPLHYAANAGHGDMVELLLGHGADINAQGESGGTPLHGAVINGSKDVIELLVLKGADINIKDRGGNTPLSEAVQLHDKEAAEFLVINGAVVEDVIDNLLKTELKPLLKAAKDGDFSTVKSLISNSADVNIRDWQSKTPLHHAVEAGNIEIVDLLLSKGAWINAKDAWNCETPLHMAVRLCRRDIVQLLLSNGADVNAKKQLDDTPLLMAALAGPEQLEKHLDSEGDDVTTDTAAYLRELEKFKSLLENDTKIDSRDLTDATPLH
ncbi:MAG: ankyrin repeat domain-containing protein, partial [Phycisphaerae bacterium]|nr:ankyrin repeat domain-containing protein [Phycisphaerae bacterium]